MRGTCCCRLRAIVRDLFETPSGAWHLDVLCSISQLLLVPRHEDHVSTSLSEEATKPPAKTLRASGQEDRFAIDGKVILARYNSHGLGRYVDEERSDGNSGADRKGTHLFTSSIAMTTAC